MHVGEIIYKKNLAKMVNLSYQKALLKLELIIDKVFNHPFKSLEHLCLRVLLNLSLELVFIDPFATA